MGSPDPRTGAEASLSDFRSGQDEVYAAPASRDGWGWGCLEGSLALVTQFGYYSPVFISIAFIYKLSPTYRTPTTAYLLPATPPAFNASKASSSFLIP